MRKARLAKNGTSVLSIFDDFRQLVGVFLHVHLQSLGFNKQKLEASYFLQVD